MIPKVINYVWLGGPKPPEVQACIESWKRVLPDYTINEYNESYLESIEVTPLFEDLVAKKKWAFVSDYLRLKALRATPGIYLDTDIFMVKPFTQEMLNLDFFVGSGEEQMLNQGVIGASADSDIIIKLIHHYESLEDINQSPREWTDLVLDHYKFSGTVDMNSDTPIELDKSSRIYPRDYFYPVHWSGVSYKRKKHLHPKFTNNTICIHWWNVSAQPKSNQNWVASQVSSVDEVTKEFLLNYLTPEFVNNLPQFNRKEL